VERRAKIVATLGPASNEPATVARLLEAGVDVVRLNLSHGDHQSHRRLIHTVRREAAEQSRHVPVLLDLMGPRYRLGEIADGPRRLKRGEEVVLGAEGTGADLPLGEAELLSCLVPGERVLIDNGLVELVIEQQRGEQLAARVVTGGSVSTRKGINLPDSELPFSISEKDRDDIAFAVAEGVDYLAASYVGQADDLVAIKRLVSEAGGALPLVAKLERSRAIDHLEEIVAEADAVMVARGDLGVEVPLDQVPVLQKRIVAAGRRSGVPVIVATQMLESMMERPRPTRAEATDVANAVLDGADALMLSGETAAGRYPVEAVETMAQIIGRAEAYQREGTGEGGRRGADHRLVLAGARPDPRHEVADVVCAAAVYAADQLGGGPIVAFSQGGFTARSIARYRPQVPIRVFTTDDGVARQIQLLWGVRPMILDGEVEEVDEVVETVDRQLRREQLARPGEAIVLVMGDPIPEKPLTNLMRVHRFADGED
jgi:pyruvate kinase